MNEKTIHGIIIGLLVILIAAFFFYAGERNIIVSNGNTHKITVSGSAQQEAMPDKATLRLAVLTEGKNPQEIQQQNSRTMNAIMAALKQSGLKESEMETTGYNLYPWQEWDQQLQKTVNRGYRVQNSLTITTTNLDKVGSYLNLAVENGVNEINGIQFSLSDEKEREVKKELMVTASKMAREKAELLADSTGASLGKVLYVTENSYQPPIWYARADKALMVEAASVAPEINPELVQVSLTVNIDYEIK